MRDRVAAMRCAPQMNSYRDRRSEESRSTGYTARAYPLRRNRHEALQER